MIDNKTEFFGYNALTAIRPYSIIKKECLREKALLTIIITTYNRDKLLYDSLDSAINQKTRFPYKILVIDNHSTNSVVTGAYFRNKYLNENITIVVNDDNYGMFGNMNQGALIADTDYISFLHDDDLYSENFVEEVMQILVHNEDISAMHVGVGSIINGEKKEVCTDIKLKMSPIYDILFNGPAAPTGIVFNRNHFLKYGGYNEKYHPTSDLCLAVLMSHTSNYYKYNKTLCYYRVEDNESLRSETLSLFVKHDFYLRSYVLKQYSLPNFIINGIQRFMVPSQVLGLRDSFNKNFTFDIKELGIKREGSWLWYAMCRVFVIMWFHIKTVKSKL